MDKILNFDTQASYDASKDSLEYPTVSYVKENDLIYFLSKPSLYEWVDLGLPSGLKWAAWNVGATKPEEYGLYFAWGETKGYNADDVNNNVKQFRLTDYKWCNGSDTTLTKYNNDSYYGTVDNILELELSDDAAYQSDNTCRMPTSGECQELIDNTTSTWETLNGVKGERLTSKINGNSIFIPFAGYYSYGSLYNDESNGYYWSSSLNYSTTVWNLDLYYDSVFMESHDRFDGRSVRAVLDK